MKTIHRESIPLEIIEIFENNDFSKLNLLIESDDSDIALFYKAIAAENGLNQKIDTEKAINIFKSLYKNGNVFAGLALAKIYQKGVTFGDRARAKIIFTEISKDKDLSISSYAKYQLLRIAEYDILNDDILEGDFIRQQTNFAKKEKIDIKTHLLDLKIKRIEKTISSYSKLIEQIKTISDDQTLTSEAKILYHQSLLEKKIIELKENYLSYLKRDFKGTRKERDSLIEFSRDQIKEKQTEVRLLLKKSAKHFILAENEILNQEIEQEFTSILNASYVKEKTIIQLLVKLEKELEKLGNVRSKLLFARIVSSFSDKAFSQIDKAIKLTREILLSDPLNKQAKQIQNNLLEPMLGKFKKQLSSVVRVAIEKGTLPDSGFFLDQVSSKRKKSSEFLYQEITQYIFEQVKDSTFLQQHVDSTNSMQIEALYTILNSRFSKEIKTLFESIELENNHETYEQIKLKFKEDVDFWSKSECAKYKTQDQVPESMIENIEKRRLFRDELVRLLYRHRTECAARIQNKDFRVVAEDGNFIRYSEDFAAILAPLMGPIYGLPISIAAIGSRTIRSYCSNLANESFKISARKFKLIGESESSEAWDNDQNAKEKFELIAMEIEKRYGMQLDEVVPGEAKFLAEMAFEKMINHLQKDSNVYKRLSLLTNNIVLGFIGMITEIKKEIYSEDNCIATLLEGLSLGELSPQKMKGDGSIEIKQKNRRLETIDRNLGWDVLGFFEKPAITNDGEKVYIRSNITDISNYGVRYEAHIPSNYTFFPQIEREGLKKKFNDNMELVVFGSRRSNSKEKQNYELCFNKQIYHESIKKVRKSLIKSVVTGVTGLVLCLEGGFATAAVLGLHTSLMVPILSSISASLSIIPPVAIGLLIVGTALTIKGIAKGITSFAEEQKLIQEKKKIVSLQDKYKLSIIEKDVFAGQEKDFVQRKSSSIFYTLLKSYLSKSSETTNCIVPKESKYKFTSKHAEKSKASNWLERSASNTSSVKLREQ